MRCSGTVLILHMRGVSYQLGSSSRADAACSITASGGKPSSKYHKLCCTHLHGHWLLAVLGDQPQQGGEEGLKHAVHHVPAGTFPSGVSLISGSDTKLPVRHTLDIACKIVTGTCRGVVAMQPANAYVLQITHAVPTCTFEVQSSQAAPASRRPRWDATPVGRAACTPAGATTRSAT
jgi:hypothetical protein